MDEALHLYLFTLEVEPLIVGETYNPLPSHLTLISRFYSHESPEYITTTVTRLLNQTKNINLLFQEPAEIGPKQTPVHLIKPSLDLKQLHAKLLKILDEVDATYTQPQFIGDGWRPHVSKRASDTFIAGETRISTALFLIEVLMHNEHQFRVVRQKFNLEN